MLRVLAALAILLAATPGAAAASQVHVTYLGDAYAVTFVSDAGGVSVPVRFGDETLHARRVEASDGDADVTYRAELPARALTYEIEGERFSIGAPPPRNGSTRIVFVADMGTDANASRVLETIGRAKPDLLVIGGDLSYANGNASVWNEWFDLVQPIAARVPMMPAYGNHEDYCQGADFELEHCGPEPNGWRAHFALPNADKLYYAFDWGPIHFTMLDTEAYVAPDAATDPDAQESFLNASLAEDDGRWNVVVYHRPLRTTNARDGLESENARDALGPLLSGRADLVLQAHLHAYERAKPENGTTFVTSGGGGRTLYANWSAMEPWVAARAAEFHILVIDASPTTLSIRALRTDDSILDSFALERPAPPSPTSAATPTTTTTAPTRPTPTTAPSANASANLTESNETPGPGLAALLAIAITLSRRRTRRLARG